MTPPKSKKLQREEESQSQVDVPAGLATLERPEEGPIQVRSVNCLNDFVAILQSEIQSDIVVPDSDSKFKNEGLVVGAGPGVSDGNGSRLPLQVEIGDVVMFGEKNVIATIESHNPPYVGRRVIIVSERNILCKLHKKMEWEEYKGD